MSGFRVFARKELLEIARTWRIWVLPGILLFFGLTGPVLAKLTPQILAAVGGGQGIVIQLTKPPTYLDAYGQWLKSLSQIGLFALIIIYGGLVSSERRSGTAVLVLTKPVSRRAFVVAKVLVHALFLTAVVVLGTALTWAETAVLFGSAPAEALWAAALSWLAFAVLFLAIMTLLSVWVGSQAAAAGVGIGLYALLAVAGVWPPLAALSPAGLVGAPSALAAGKNVAVLWPVLTSLGLATLLVAAAAAVFRRQEL